MQDETTTTRSPGWWTQDQDRGWDRVKAAFRRDWEQTKADLTGDRQGSDLNQQASDTLAQAFGKQPVPSETTINPMDADELESHVARAAKQATRVADRLADDTEKSIAKRAETTGDGGWSDAEAPIRFGHGAASHFGTAWDDNTELQLRTEWTDLHPARPWDDVRDSVRRGWGGGPA